MCGGCIQSVAVAARLRHLAISVPDVAAAQAFFEQAFGMTKAGDAGRGVYMTDGVMNVALLHFGDDPVVGITEDGSEPFYGLYRFGMWVDDLDDASEQVEAAGPSICGAGDPMSQTATTRSSTARPTA